MDAHTLGPADCHSYKWVGFRPRGVLDGSEIEAESAAHGVADRDRPVTSRRLTGAVCAPAACYRFTAAPQSSRLQSFACREKSKWCPSRSSAAYLARGHFAPQLVEKKFSSLRVACSCLGVSMVPSGLTTATRKPSAARSQSLRRPTSPPRFPIHTRRLPTTNVSALHGITRGHPLEM